MTCPHCAIAAERQHDGYALGCRGCIARGLARTRMAANRRVYGQDRAWRRLLEHNGVTDDEVTAAARADVELVADLTP